MRLCFKKARQIHRSCFSPADKLVFDTIPDSPPFSVIVSNKLQSFKIFSNSSSVYLPVKSKFYLNVDLIRVGSWSIIVIEFLISFNGYDKIDCPSMRMSPWEISVMRNRLLIIVVLPAPVRPTMPTFSPGEILQDTPIRTLGRSVLYLT